MVPQTPVVFDDTIRNNILFGLRRFTDSQLMDAEGPLDVTNLPEWDLFQRGLNCSRTTHPEWDRLVSHRTLIRQRVVERCRLEGVVNGDGAAPNHCELHSDQSAADRPGRSLRAELVGEKTAGGPQLSEQVLDQVLFHVLRETNLSDSVVLLGMEEPAGSGGGVLSGGQRQKIGLARAIIKRPQLMILDEATTALDERSRQRIVTTLQEDCRDITILAVSHARDEILTFDRIVVMEQGCIRQSGTYRELINRPGAFRRLMGYDSTTVAKRPPTPDSSSFAAGDPEELHHIVSCCPLFRSLGSHHFRRLEREWNIVDLSDGDILFEKGESGKELFVVVCGQVDFFVPHEGGTRIVGNCSAGGSFGELAVLSEQPRAVGARSTGSSRVLTVSRETVLNLLAEDSELSLNMLNDVSHLASRLAGEAYCATP